MGSAVLSGSLLILSILYYLLRSREIKLHVIGYMGKITFILKMIIIPYALIILIFLVVHTNFFTYTPESLVSSSYFFISMMCTIFSMILFINSFKIKPKYLIELDKPSRLKSRKGTIKLGKIISNNKAKYKFFLDISDLAQHMFVCGVTGTGKSNFIQHFLLNFTQHHDLPFLLTEFKGEYQFLQKKIEDLLILKPGENFSINIFDPEGADPEVHAERVFQIFESGGLLEGVEYSPQMERAFVDILNKIRPKPENRNWEAFRTISEKYGSENSDLMYKKSVTAVQNRIRRYSLGTLKNVFVKKSGLAVKELFDHKVLLDLSSIIRLGGEKEDALFFLNMILKYLWDKNIGIGSKNYEGIKHITIIEDAQYFAPEELSSRTKLSSYLEDIALLLRGTGECLITLATRPKISKEILANCGVLVSFQNHMQKDVMQELLNIDEEQKEYLSMLQRGQCIIRVNSIEKPFLLITPYIERSWLSDEEIIENNRKIIEHKFTKLQENTIEYCPFCGSEMNYKLENKNCGFCKAHFEVEERKNRLRKIYDEFKDVIDYNSDFKDIIDEENKKSINS